MTNEHGHVKTVEAAENAAPTVPEARPAEDAMRPGGRRNTGGGGDFLGRMAIPSLLVAGFALFSVLSPDLFFTWT